MKLSSINPEIIKQISDQELLSLHRRVHQLYSLARNRKNEKLCKAFIKVHITIVREMKRRGLLHRTRIMEKILSYLSGGYK